MTELKWYLEPQPGAWPIDDPDAVVRLDDGFMIVPAGYRLKMLGGMAEVRCPHCNRLACRATGGATVEVKCVRCGKMSTQEAGASRAPIASD